MPSKTSRAPRRRALAIQVLVALLLGAFGVVVPLPRIVEQPAMATETRRPFAGQTAPTSSTTLDLTPTTAPSDLTTSTSTDEGLGDPTTAPPGTESPPTTSSPAPTGDDERVSVVEDTRDFNLIGITLDEVPTAPVRVRTAVDGGDWSQWEELDFDVEVALDPVPGAPVPVEPDDDNPGAHSDPLWVGDGSRYELDLPAGATEGAQVHLVYETSRKVAVAETAPAGADPTRPAVHSRASWGARPPKVAPTIAPSLEIAVVHHSAGTNNYSSDDVPALLRGIQAYHMDANGWNDIGYNFAVDRFGRIFEARAGGINNAVVGGHARGFNTGSTGVVVLGNYETAAPTTASVSAVASIIGWMFAVHETDPRTPAAYRAGDGSPKYPPGTVVTMNRIVGHSDVGLTACPGGNLYPQLATIRSSVAAAYPRLAAPGIALVGNYAGDGADDIFLRQPGVHSDSLLVASSGRFTRAGRYSVQGTAYRPRVGDFDGNGLDDIFWYGPGAVADSIWLARHAGGFQRVVTTVKGVYSPVIGDFNADGADDVFWFAPGSAPESVWLAAGGGRFVHVAVRSVDHPLRPVAGDFDRDGDDDIFWHGPGSAGDAVWVAQNGGFTSRSVTQVRGSYLPVTGDFDGDGADDIFWYAPGSPPESVWLARADMSFRSASVPAVRGLYPYGRSGDFNGDGRDEMLWYSSPGQDAIWWHASTGLFGRSVATDPPLR